MHQASRVALCLVLFLSCSLGLYSQQTITSEAGGVAPHGHAKTSPGPFGLEAGMTKEAVVAKLGAKAIVEAKEDMVVLKTAPSPHPDFESYILMFSPKIGLVKIAATSHDIVTSQYGNELKNKYETLLSALKAKYGNKPRVDIDLLQSGSMWTEPQYWMMGLVKKERSLFAIWDQDALSQAETLPAGLSAVAIEAKALNLERDTSQSRTNLPAFQNIWCKKNQSRIQSFRGVRNYNKA